MPAGYNLGPGPGDVFRTFVLPIPLDAPRYVRAVEFQPGHAHVVHHANLGIDRSGSARRQDGRDADPGYAGGMVPDAVPEGQLLGWTPGQTPRDVPPDLSWRVDPGSDLVAQVHLRPSGRPEHVQIRVGLYFSAEPPSRTPVALRLGSQTIDIPAGARQHVVTDAYVLPVDVDVAALQPHAHYLGRTMEAYAEKPGGATEWLISIRDWDFNWQDVYRYRKPVRLPRGTRIVMRYTYDNSAANPRNPHRPPRRVVWGQNTTDEMGDLWLQVVPRTSGDASILKEDFARKAFADDVAAYTRLARAEPSNPLRRDVLGGLYLQAGRLEEAVAEFRASLDANPDSAPTRYNLGLALSRRGLREEAIAQFERALRIDPEHGEAQNNLGVLLFALGRRNEALFHVARAADLRPTNANARTNLGQMLTVMGHDAEAVAAFRLALAVDSSWVPALNGLAWVLAASRDQRVRAPMEAISLAERASAVTVSSDPVALNVLAAAQASAGRWDDAVATAQKAADLAAAQQRPELESEVRTRVAQYREHRPPYAERP
jgi:tetratricopeptide (TPR) repeat protein